MASVPTRTKTKECNYRVCNEMGSKVTRCYNRCKVLAVHVVEIPEFTGVNMITACPAKASGKDL